MSKSLERKSDLRLLTAEITKVLGWHSRLNFKPEFGEESVSLMAEKLTPEYDAELDLELLHRIFEFYEQRFEELELSDYDFEVEVGQTENLIFISITYPTA